MADDIEIKIKVDAQGAVTLLDKTGAEVKKLGEASKAASDSFRGFGSILEGVGQSIGAKLIPAIQDLPKMIADFASRGSEIDDMGSAFERLAQSAGVTSEAFLGQLKQATAGTISDLNLMQRSNEALNAGLTPDNLITVANAARAMGETFGGDLKTNFDALLDSLQRGDDKFLKARGIIIDNQKASEEFAKKIGVAADSLSELGKAQAIQEASLKALQTEFQKAGEITEDTGDILSQITTGTENFRDGLMKAIATNPDFIAAITAIRDSLASVDFKGFAETAGLAVKIVVDSFIELKRALGDIFSTISNEIDKTAEAFENLGIGDAFRGALPGVKEFEKGLDHVVALLKQKTPEALSKAREELVQLNQTAGQSVIIRTALGDSLETVNAIFQKAKTETLGLTKATETLSKTNEKLAVQTLPKLKTGLVQNKDKTKSLVEVNKEFESKTKDVIDQLTRGIITNEQAATAIDQLGAAYIKSGQEAENFAKIHEQVVDEALQKTIDKQNQLDKELAKNKSGLLGFDWLTTNNEAADKAIGQVGQELVNAAADGLNRADVRPLSEALVSIIGEASGLPPEAAQLLGKTLGTQIGRVLEKLGDDTEGTKARKSVDKYFADLFKGDRLGIIVGDELKRLSDLVFRGDTLFGGNADFGTGTFDDFFRTFSDQAQNAFSGVGAAFEQMLGQAGEISGQVAAVLANNIGGSINNLQLLVQATGVSFEDLHTQIVNAFLDGKLSVEEAQNSLVGLAQVAQSGIPDGIGLIDQAFKNLQAAGTKGGRALIDALQDIGFEAIELGQKDFATLEAELKTRLPSASEAIDQLFTTLESTGIHSIDQLTKATAEDLLPALAELSRQKFPFEEQSKSITDLIQKMENFPEEVNSRINIEVNTRYTGETQAYVNSGGKFPEIGTNAGR